MYANYNISRYQPQPIKKYNVENLIDNIKKTNSYVEMSNKIYKKSLQKIINLYKQFFQDLNYNSYL